MRSYYHLSLNLSDSLSFVLSGPHFSPRRKKLWMYFEVCTPMSVCLMVYVPIPIYSDFDCYDFIGIFCVLSGEEIENRIIQ